MRRRSRVLVSLILVAAAALVGRADNATSQSAEVQLQLADLLYSEGRFLDALTAYRNAADAAGADLLPRARSGVIRAALRCAEFDEARTFGEQLASASPRDPEALSLYGDALWSAGLFDQAESRYRDGLALEPELARGRHGLARSLAGRGHLDEALNQAQAALRLAPRDAELHHTVGTLYERMRRFSDAAASFNNYVNLLPNKDISSRAAWSRAEIRFLQSFGQRVPYEVDRGSENKLFTMPFKLVNDKIVVRAKINDAVAQDFVVDTGSEQTVITRPTAIRLGVLPITYTLSAGVGSSGFRGLQLGRVDSLEVGSLKLRNIPVLIKNPPLPDVNTREVESLSPLALGYSMTIDYKSHEITFGKQLPEEPADVELPMRLYRLATVLGTIDGRQGNFVIDTGGQVISISQAMATSLRKPPSRKIALKVWGTSGWDPDAFLLPGVNLSFDAIQYRDFPVVVLNLDAPSALLGFQLGGIVGHKFLAPYRVAIDMERSVLRLKKLS